MEQKLSGSLIIESGNGRSKVEIIGDRATILFNWSLLTESVSVRLGIPLTFLLSMTEDCLNTINSHVYKTDSVRVNLNGFEVCHPQKEDAT